MKLPVTDIEPIINAVHLCIDMQRTFARGGIWETPWMERVLPAVVTLSALQTERTICDACTVKSGKPGDQRKSTR
jgi:nicotinamidase-related amidase